MDSTLFFALLFIHLAGLILGFGAVMVTDLYGVLWLRNRVRFPQLVRVSGVTETFIWMGWVTMVAVGIPLVALKGTVDNLMLVKLFFVVLIGINGVFLHRLHKQVRGCAEGDDVPTPVLFRLGLSLFVSQLGWWGAVVIGFLHRHVQSIIEWPDFPWLWIGGIVVALIAILALGEMLIRQNPEEAEDVKEKITP